MATKRKPKSEPILNAEPLHSRGVIVTHPERHITPGNASIVWLIVMMAIIGASGALCTYIWWQKEDLASQIEAPYMMDNGRYTRNFLRGLRDKMMLRTEPVAEVTTVDQFNGQPIDLRFSYPSSLDAFVNVDGLSTDRYTVRFDFGPVVDSEKSNPAPIFIERQPADKKLGIDAYIKQVFGKAIAIEDYKAVSGLTWKEVTVKQQTIELSTTTHAFILVYKDQEGKDAWLTIRAEDRGYLFAENIANSVELIAPAKQ